MKPMGRVAHLKRWAKNLHRMLAKLSAFSSWANHGWPTIWIQTAAGFLLAFGLGCVLRMGWTDFLFGPIFGVLVLTIGDPNLPNVGWTCLTLSALLALLTFPAQKRRLASLRKEQAMLERKDWRK